MKKIFVSAYLCGNLGDDLFIRTLIQRYPNIQFEAIAEKGYQKSLKSHHNFKIIQSELSEISNNYLAVVEIGGALFQQISSKTDIPSYRKFFLKKFPHYFVVGSNFSEYSSTAYVNNYNYFFKKIDGAVFRDYSSYNLFSHLNNIKYAPDVVFDYNIKKYNMVSKEKTISIVPIDLNYKKRVNKNIISMYNAEYISKLVNVIEDFCKKGWKINLISFCDFEGDSKAIDRIVAALSDKSIKNVTIFNDNKIDAKINAIAKSSFLISSRFHSMILGWKFQIKQIVIPYSKKTTNVIRDLFPKQETVLLSKLKLINLSASLKQANTIPLEKLRQCERKSVNQFHYLDVFLKKYN
ncbi:polysaccharide pyruvyl transferase family protein [Liquorilactobacillus nagelii]|uniref:polysaccharide pyruvyl transferase family protein n=1 Tax=Liquorilactobacillus nagelii TaxID=82688 RepID=UPI0039EC05AD